MFDKAGLFPFFQFWVSLSCFFQAVLLKEFKPGAEQLIVRFAGEDIAQGH